MFCRRFRRFILFTSTVCRAWDSFACACFRRAGEIMEIFFPSPVFCLRPAAMVGKSELAYFADLCAQHSVQYEEDPANAVCPTLFDICCTKGFVSAFLYFFVQ